MFDRVSKTYGRINALSSVSLGISGGVTGILGMNGAGKSTLFKLMMGKVKPSSGAIRLFGIDPWKNPAPYSRVGFVPEHEKMYDWMTALDFIVTFARLHGMTRKEAKRSNKSVRFRITCRCCTQANWTILQRNAATSENRSRTG